MSRMAWSKLLHKGPTINLLSNTKLFKACFEARMKTHPLYHNQFIKANCLASLIQSNSPIPSGNTIDAIIVNCTFDTLFPCKDAKLNETNPTKVYRSWFSPKDSTVYQNAYCYLPYENKLPPQLPAFNATEHLVWTK